MKPFDPKAQLNDVLTSLPPSGIRKLFDIAAGMDGVISLGIGEPDFITPWHIRNAGIHSLEKGRTQYTANAGLKELRAETARYLRRRFGLEYGPENILITVGGSEAIDLTMRAFIRPGDEVIVPQPSFVCYGPLAALAGAKPVYVELKPEDGFKLTPDALKAALTPRTKLLVLPFPNNPTGSIMTTPELEAIAEVLRGTDVMVLSDEIYGELTYTEARHVSIASLPGMKERTVIVGGFSKAYAMTGWRLGYAVSPVEVNAALTKIHQYAIMCAPRMAQVAALEALRAGRQNGYEDVLRMRESYDRRRRLMLEGFRGMGLSCFEPLGAFYVFPSIARTGLSSEEFCQRLLREKNVACVPGTAFAPCGEGHIRCSYATALDKLNIALDRMGEVIRSR